MDRKALIAWSERYALQVGLGEGEPLGTITGYSQIASDHQPILSTRPEIGNPSDVCGMSAAWHITDMHRVVAEVGHITVQCRRDDVRDAVVDKDPQAAFRRAM